MSILALSSPKLFWRTGDFDSAIQGLVSAQSLGLPGEEADEVLEYLGRVSNGGG